MTKKSSTKPASKKGGVNLGGVNSCVPTAQEEWTGVSTENEPAKPQYSWASLASFMVSQNELPDHEEGTLTHLLSSVTFPSASTHLDACFTKPYSELRKLYPSEY